MRALITGINGFAGSHLAEHLVASGDEVWGTILPGSDTCHLAAVIDRVTLRGAELEAARLGEVLAEARPTVVYHLAGQAHVGLSWRQRAPTLAVNALGTAALLDAVLTLAGRPRVVLASTGEVYGRTGSPFSEDSPIHADTPYALSKVMAEEIGMAYQRWDGLEVVVARAFNHTGPRQAPNFVCSEFARTVAEIALDRCPATIEVGNLAARRDFSDVRDTVRGYRLLAHAGTAGRPYNICSGRGVPVQEILDRLLPLAGRSVEVRVDPARFRPLDAPALVGDGRRADAEIDYRPTIPLDTTLADLVGYWRESLL